MTSRTLPDSVATETTTEIASTQDGAILGTPGFMSPEQAQGKSSSLDARSDIFSLGKLLEAIVTQQNTGEPARVPEALRAIYKKAAAEDRSERYANVAALAEDISLFLDGMPVAAYEENLWERAQRFYSRYRAAIILITVYLLVRGLVVLYARR